MQLLLHLKTINPETAFFNFQDNYEKFLVTTETKSNSRCVFFLYNDGQTTASRSCVTETGLSSSLLKTATDDI